MPFVGTETPSHFLDFPRDHAYKSTLRTYSNTMKGNLYKDADVPFFNTSR